MTMMKTRRRRTTYTKKKEAKRTARMKTMNKQVKCTLRITEVKKKKKLVNGGGGGGGGGGGMRKEGGGRGRRDGRDREERVHETSTSRNMGNKKNANEEMVISTKTAATAMTAFCVSMMSFSSMPSVADEASRAAAQKLVAEIARERASSNTGRAVSVYTEDVAQKRLPNKLITQAPAVEKVPKKKRYKSEIAKPKEKKTATTSSTPGPQLDVKLLAPVVAIAGLPVVGGVVASRFFGIDVLGIVSEATSKITSSLPSFDSEALAFLDNAMMKNVDELGVGGEAVIKSDEFRKKNKTVRKKAKK